MRRYTNTRLPLPYLTRRSSIICFRAPYKYSYLLLTYLLCTRLGKDSRAHRSLPCFDNFTL